jgi:putative heme iron utilization protein
MDIHTGIQYKLRLPPELKAKIAESSKALNRSMNADIVARLEQSFAAQTIDTQPSDMQQLIAELRTESREIRMLYVETLNRLSDMKKPAE